jgi:hypothetical protein
MIILTFCLIFIIKKAVNIFSITIYNNDDDDNDNDDTYDNLFINI